MIDKEQNLNEPQKPELGISDVAEDWFRNNRKGCHYNILEWVVGYV